MQYANLQNKSTITWVETPVYIEQNYTIKNEYTNIEEYYKENKKELKTEDNVYIEKLYKTGK